MADVQGGEARIVAGRDGEADGEGVPQVHLNGVERHEIVLPVALHEAGDDGAVLDEAQPHVRRRVEVVGARRVVAVARAGEVLDPLVRDGDHAVGALACVGVTAKHDPALAPGLVGAGEAVDEAGDGDVGGAIEVQVVELVVSALSRTKRAGTGLDGTCEGSPFSHGDGGACSADPGWPILKRGLLSGGGHGEAVAKSASQAKEGGATVASTADEAVAKGASTAEVVVAKDASTADKVVANGASTADVAGAKVTSTAEVVVAKDASTADKAVANGASTAGTRPWPRARPRRTKSWPRSHLLRTRPWPKSCLRRTRLWPRSDGGRGCG